MAHDVSRKSAVVIGGANMDICGTPRYSLLMNDSNPGTVTLRPGGVGRNIANDLALMGMHVSFITVMGDDVFGKALMENCLSAGLDMSMSAVLPGKSSSSYLYVTDSEGEMLVAVNDMDITDMLSPDMLAPLMERINAADAVVIDANLSCDAIEFLAENCTAPMYADAVSAAKAARLTSALPKLEAIKPNRLEARELTGLDNIQDAADELIRRGVKRVFISLGRGGMIACEGDTHLTVPGYPAQVVNTNGAGDSVTAAIVYGTTHGYELRRIAELAAKAGAVSVSSAESSAPGLADIVNNA